MRTDRLAGQIDWLPGGMMIDGSIDLCLCFSYPFTTIVSQLVSLFEGGLTSREGLADLLAAGLPES